MKIETKYDIGQEVWFMWGNKAIQREIASVDVRVDSEEQYETYEIVGLEDDDDALYDWTFEIDDIFPTKEELLKSL